MYVPCAPIVSPAKPSPAPLDAGHVDLREQLALADGGHVHAEEELVGGDRSLAALPADREGRVERDEERREVVRRIAHADVPADRPAVPHLDVGDRRRHLREDRPRHVDLGRGLQLRVRDHRADLEHPVGGEADRRAARRDRRGRRARPATAARCLHHVDERLPAGERARAVVRREHRDRLLDRGRACVLDLAQEHEEIQSRAARDMSSESETM